METGKNNIIIKQLEVQNLRCTGCEKTIVSKIPSILGVDEVTVNVNQSVVRVQVTSNEVVRLVIDKLSQLGYPIVSDENSMGKKAKSIVSCAVGKMSS
ncbi:MAG: heavy metal-associated domain-containing protein [Crocinitomicaceae bacterium]|nr:heavy metal-associated domain-containing protein [Crocinitomicaceae bacterium]MDG1776281.1 heavy metal-associated domain-containing protein [Crocinitomicaceae bacterium]